MLFVARRLILGSKILMGVWSVRCSLSDIAANTKYVYVSALLHIGLVSDLLHV